MSEKGTKKRIILDILEVLKTHSDKDHTLTQQQVLELLLSEKDIHVDRKTVRRNLSKLLALEYPIKYRGSENEDDEKKTILTDWYYDHPFSNGELRLLIDSVTFADGLSKRYRLDLIRKLEGLSNKYFRSVTSKIDMTTYSQITNGHIMLTLENIGNAVAGGKQISFHYCTCGIDEKLHIKNDENGKPKVYTVNPYQLISRNGHSYLICNLPQYDDLTHFRVDRIKDSVVLDTSSKSLRELKAFKAGLKLSDYIKEHPNLWSGTPVHTTFRCKQYMMNDIVDSFGTDLRIEELPGDMIKVHVDASEESMLHWAVQFADEVEVLSPAGLRKQIADMLRNALSKYEQ